MALGSQCSLAGVWSRKMSPAGPKKWSQQTASQGSAPPTRLCGCVLPSLACAESPGQTVSGTAPRTRRGACPPQLTADPTSHSHLIGDETQGAWGKDFSEVTYPLSGRRGPKAQGL